DEARRLEGARRTRGDPFRPERGERGAGTAAAVARARGASGRAAGPAGIRQRADPGRTRIPVPRTGPHDRGSRRDRLAPVRAVAADRLQRRGAHRPRPGRATRRRIERGGTTRLTPSLSDTSPSAQQGVSGMGGKGLLATLGALAACSAPLAQPATIDTQAGP